MKASSGSGEWPSRSNLGGTFSISGSIEDAPRAAAARDIFHAFHRRRSGALPEGAMRQNTSTRRTFLCQSAALLAAPAVPGLLDQSTTTGAGGAADDNILVVVQLVGGNDGLNTVVPFADDAYHRLRPGLRLDAESVHKLNDTVGLHPNLRPLLDVYGRREMAVVQG